MSRSRTARRIHSIAPIVEPPPRVNGVAPLEKVPLTAEQEARVRREFETVLKAQQMYSAFLHGMRALAGVPGDWPLVELPGGGLQFTRPDVALAMQAQARAAAPPQAPPA